MKHKEIKNNLLYLLISIAVFCISISLSIGSGYVTNSGEITSIQGRIVITIIYLPTLIGYIFYIFKIFKKLKYFNFLNFVVGLFSLFILFIHAIGGFGGYVCADLVFFLFIPLVFGVPFFLIQDIMSWTKYIKEHIKNRKNND